MDTLTQPAVSKPPDPLAEAMEEVEAWFDGGLPPEPWAA